MFYDLLDNPDYFYLNSSNSSKRNFIKKMKKVELDKESRLCLNSGDGDLLALIVSLSMLFWGNEVNLNFIDVSKVDDFSFLFSSRNIISFRKDFLDRIRKSSKVDGKTLKTLIGSRIKKQRFLWTRMGFY